QPSIYGMNNELVLYALKHDQENLRGIVVVDSHMSVSSLEAMNNAGVRGYRANLLFKGGIEFSEIVTVANKVADFKWHAELLIDIRDLPELRQIIEALPVEV